MRTTRAAGMLVFTTVAWGAMFAVGKSALGVLDAYWLSAARYVPGALVKSSLCQDIADVAIPAKHRLVRRKAIELEANDPTLFLSRGNAHALVIVGSADGRCAPKVAVLSFGALFVVKTNPLE